MAQPISPEKIIALLLASLLITIPFTFLGIALGYSTNTKSAVAVANLLYLPLTYLGGLWMPPDRLPAGIANLSQFTPTRHAGEIGWAIVGGHQVPASSIIWLVGFSVAFAIFAYWRYQRDERKRYA
jgi:ABC-2 type transport system permease protein